MSIMVSFFKRMARDHYMRKVRKYSRLANNARMLGWDEYEQRYRAKVLKYASKTLAMM